MKTKYKPFDLEAAKNGAPVITRDGRLARIVCFDFKTDGGQRLLVLIEQSDGTEQAFSYHDNGSLIIIKQLECNENLVMARVKNKGWINIYPSTRNDLVSFVSHAFASRVKADFCATAERIACIEIEWEE